MKKILLLMIVVIFCVSIVYATTNDAVFYFDLDGYNMVGNTVIDSADNYNGTNSGATVNVTGKINNSFDFDSGSDYVSVTSGGTGVVSNVNSPRSVGAWFNWDGSGRYLFYEGTSKGEWDLRTDAGFLACEFYNGGWVNISFPFSDTSSWYYVNCVYNGSHGFLYVNSSLISSANVGDLSTDTKGITVSYNHATVMFDGQIDEFGYWNKTLSQAEINELYNNGNGFNPYDNTAPTITINSPADNDHDNVNLTVNLTLTDADAGDGINATLYVNDSIHDSVGLQANGTTVLLNGTGMTDGTYSWYVYACDNSSTPQCTNSTARTYVVDTVSPVITFRTPASGGSVSTGNLTSDIEVTDTNLWRANYTVSYSNGTVFFNHYESNLTGQTSYNFTDQVNFTSDGNYTVLMEATDSHTFNLRGMTYSLDNTGITFSRYGKNKKIWFGYRKPNGDMSLLTSQEIQDYNISASLDIVDREYDWHLNYKKPSTNIKFGFAIPKQNMILIDPSIGHFVYDMGLTGVYIDFQDLTSAGYTLNYMETPDYHVIWTNTDECLKQVGEMCKI